MRKLVRLAPAALTAALLAALLLPAGTGHAMPYDILDAAKRGDDHAARKLLEQDPALARTLDAQGYSPLHWAAVRGHWHIVGHVLDAGATLEAGAPVDVIGGDGGSALHWACHHDRPDMVARILDAGADIVLANQWGRTPLHVAARRGCRAVAELLLARGADPNAPTREGWTPLHVAHKAGHPALVELLLARGADPERTDGEGQRPVDHAFTRPGAVELAAEALEEYTGLYDLGGGYAFKIWREGDGLRIREFAPDGLVPIGPDEFYCVQEPWRVTFVRGGDGAITGVDVAFLRRTVHGERRGAPRYVGSQACRDCHFSGVPGNPYMQWVASRHAAAYWRLATDWAKLLATFRPAYRDISEPIAEDRCLLCHTTTAQEPDALADGTFRPEEGVGCEMCHGPGSLYLDPEIMGDRERFLASGGIVPDADTCAKCHRNPDRFDFATWWPKVQHVRAPAEGHSGD